MNHRSRHPKEVRRIELEDLVAPGAAAVVTQEYQRGVVGGSMLPDLVAGAGPTVPRIARLGQRRLQRTTPYAAMSSRESPRTMRRRFINDTLRVPARVVIPTTPWPLKAEER
jgi:hypothetical protein